MKSKPILIILLAALSIQGYAQSTEELIRARVVAGETPGIAVATYKNGEIKYYTFGYADVAGGRKVDSKTLFEIGSVTKTFTTTMLAVLAEEGKISLTDEIQKYLPAEVTIPTRADKSITFLDLATAHSGLPRLPDNFNPADSENPYIDYTEVSLFYFLSGYTLTRDIGSKYEYSNLGMGLAGVLVTKIDKRTYRESVTARILSPLKMSSTFINTPGRTDKNSATGYSGKRAVKAWTWNDQSCLQGAGGLLSNAEDMMRYLIANLNPSDNILGKAMTNAQQPKSDAGPRSKIALGWHLRNNIVWHNGGTGGFKSFVGFDPTKKVAVVVLTNSNTGADDLGFHLLDSAMAVKKLRMETAVESKVLVQYPGTYEITPAFSIEVTLDKSQLAIQATGQPKIEIYPESDTKFFLKVVDAQIEFFKNGQGEVEKLVLYQGGQSQNARKVK